MAHPRRTEKPVGKLRAKIYQKHDVEEAVAGESSPKSEASLGRQKVLLNAGHYDIAQQMKHYHSVDFGNKCEQGIRR